MGVGKYSGIGSLVWRGIEEVLLGWKTFDSMKEAGWTGGAVMKGGNSVVI